MLEFREFQECPGCGAEARFIGNRLVRSHSKDCTGPFDLDLVPVRYYREGRVPVTDSMVERLTDWLWNDGSPGDPLWTGDRDDYRAKARAALAAALNGGEDE